MIHIDNISNHNQELFTSRRGFLKGMLGAGAFILSVRLMPEQLFAATANATAADAFAKAPLQPNVYLAIDTDGTAYIIAHRSEMGSGSRTALPRIVADELDADWARVKIVQAIGDEKYGDQDTDGSHSVRSFFDTLREAGATARLMLVRAAAGQWGVPPTECSTNLHTVVHKASGKKLKRVALHRKRHDELRPERHVHRESGVRAGYAHGRNAVRQRGAPAGLGQ